MSLRRPALDPATVPPRSSSTYPEPFRSRVLPREKRALGDALGLTRVGVNLTTLAPGKESSMRHHHSHEDELVFVLEGELVLMTDDGEQVLTAGMCAGFPAGSTDAHQLINRSDRPARYLEISNRDAADEVAYPDVDLALRFGPDRQLLYSHKDGTPYPARSSEADPRIEEVLGFWFADPSRWWVKDPAFDAEIRDRFAALHGELERGELERWQGTPRGVLATVIVLDQFSRNMFRDTGRMFATDAQALAAASAAIERGDDQALAPEQRAFLYMPFMHSEDLAVQDRSVALFAALGRPEQLDFAERHRAIIQRFGRYPHRNALLGRASTAEELAFLTQPGSSF